MKTVLPCKALGFSYGLISAVLGKCSLLVSFSSAIKCKKLENHLWSSGNTGSLVGDGVEHVDGVASGPLVVVVPDHLEL